MHSNFREPGFEYKDDLKTGIKSAIKGGFTSVLLMPQTEPVIDNKSHVEYIKNNTKQKNHQQNLGNSEQVFIFHKSGKLTGQVRAVVGQ